MAREFSTHIDRLTREIGGGAQTRIAAARSLPPLLTPADAAGAIALAKRVSAALTDGPGRTDPAIAASGCRLLGLLCLRQRTAGRGMAQLDRSTGSECRELVSSTPGFFPAVVGALRAHISDAEVAMSAFGAVQTSSKKCVESVAEALSAGAVEAIAEAMARHPGNLKCLALGTEAVTDMMFCAEGVRRAGEAGCAHGASEQAPTAPSRHARALASQLGTERCAGSRGVSAGIEVALNFARCHPGCLEALAPAFNAIVRSPQQPLLSPSGSPPRHATNGHSRRTAHPVCSSHSAQSHSGRECEANVVRAVKAGAVDCVLRPLRVRPEAPPHPA